MNITTTPPYEEMRKSYSHTFSLGYLKQDINTKFALISLIGYLNYKIKKKKSNVTPYKIIKQIVGDTLPEDFIKGLSVVVDDFSYGCTIFPTFGLEDKNIPAKIKEILSTYTPF